MKRYTLLLSVLLSLGLTACVTDPVHQGNRLSNSKAFSIHKGDTKFSIEQKLGAPVLDNILHPNRVTYFEQFEDQETGVMRRRGIEIIYDDAKRAKEIRRFGFDKEKQIAEQ